MVGGVKEGLQVTVWLSERTGTCGNSSMCVILQRKWWWGGGGFIAMCLHMYFCCVSLRVLSAVLLCVL